MSETMTEFTPNKNLQFAPTGPVAKTAARFRRRCGRRYMHMRIILAVIAMSLFSNAHAFKPGKCETALNNLAVNLQTQNKLGTPLAGAPNEEYKYGHLPNICILKGMQETTATNWLIHKNSDDVTVIIEERVIETLKSNYYGPFKSAYKK